MTKTSFVFLFLLATVNVFAERVQFREETPVEGFPSLVVAEVPELETQILYSANGLIPEDAKGVIFLFPGTSANVNSEYGLARSLSPLAKKFQDQGFAVAGFRPPIYHNAHDPHARKPYLDKYSHIDANVAWLGRVVELVRHSLPHGKSLPFVYYGRSTFAAVGLQAYHDYAKGNADASFLQYFQKMSLPGLDGTTEEDIQKWHESELDFYFAKHPEKGDAPVILSAPTLFREMTWQREELVEAPAKGLPRLCFACAIADEFCGGQPSTMLGPVADFAKLHPHASIKLLLHDGMHSPAQQRPGELPSDTDRRMNAIIKEVLDIAPGNPGVQFAYIPDRHSVLSASPKNRVTTRSARHRDDSRHREFDRCATLVDRMIR